MGKEAELIKAAKTGDIRTLERHFSHLNKRSSMIGRYEESFLHVIECGFAVVVISPLASLFYSLPNVSCYSIKKHLHPNIQDEVGYTLLHHATLNGQRETVSFLLQNGASTTIPDTSGKKNYFVFLIVVV